MPASESEPKVAPQEDIASRASSAVKSISQKSSSMDIKSRSSTDMKRSTSQEVKKSPPPEVEGRFVPKQITHETASKADPKNEVSELLSNVNSFYDLANTLVGI